MPDLPLGDYPFYAGIDPGHKGAIALLNAAGTMVKVWDMPVADREIDLGGLRECFRCLTRLPRVAVGIEWPVAYPGTFANVSRDAENFGRQKGYLESFAYLSNLDYFRIAPTLWKGRLGLQGKEHDPDSAAGLALWRTMYPEKASVVLGPRGGLRDGRLDALLIAHFLRIRATNGITSTVAKFGKGSTEALVAVFGNRRKRRGKFWQTPDPDVY